MSASSEFDKDDKSFSSLTTGSIRSSVSTSCEHVYSYDRASGDCTTHPYHIVVGTGRQKLVAHVQRGLLAVRVQLHFILLLVVTEMDTKQSDALS